MEELGCVLWCQPGIRVVMKIMIYLWNKIGLYEGRSRNRLELYSDRNRVKRIACRPFVVTSYLSSADSTRAPSFK